MSVAPEYNDLHRLVDRLTPVQVRALRAVALELVRDERSDDTRTDEATRSLSFIGIAQGDADLAERSQQILWDELGHRRSTP